MISTRALPVISAAASAVAVIVAVVALQVALHRPTPTPSTKSLELAAAMRDVEPNPYDAYLAGNPQPWVILTPQDAALRAWIGCDYFFPPDTVDAALANAYRPAGICTLP